MTGGLINIVSYSNTDLYLTASPQITFFKSVYRRHTNFACESITIPINNLNFDNITEIIIPKLGDLLYKTYLEIDLPSVQITTTDIDSSINNDTYNTLKDKLISLNSDYILIKKYIEMNLYAYIIGINDIDAVNVVDPKTIIETILKDIGSIDQYNDLLIKYNFNPCLSNIKIIMENLLKNKEIQDYSKNNKNNIINGIRDEKSKYLINIIKNRLNNSIDECKKIKKYFEEIIKQNEDKLNNIDIIDFEWNDNLGHLMIDWIEIYIGTELIDKHYGDWLNIIDEVFIDNKYRDEMINNKNKLIIPLQFWFCKLTGLAFPLIALQHNELKLRIKIKPITDCCKISLDNQDIMPIIWNNKNYTLRSNLIVEYIYLDIEERKKMAQSSHEYLIETIEMNEFKSNGITDIKCELDFKGPTKEIIWIAKSSNNSFDYIPVKSSKCTFGDIAVINSNSKELNYLSFYKYHSKIPINNINIISFSLRPEEHQPSGSINLSKTPNLLLFINLEKEIDCIIRVFSIRYNVLRFYSGYSALAYS